MPDHEAHSLKEMTGQERLAPHTFIHGKAT